MSIDDLWFGLADVCLFASVWVSSSLYRVENEQLRTVDSLHVVVRTVALVVVATLILLKVFKFF